MFIWNRCLDRRTFLRGMGASVALPLLDAMIPARALLASTRPVPRLAFVYFPHGAVMDEWTPAGMTGRVAGVGEPGQKVIALRRILQPLDPFRHRLTVVSGLENRHAYGPVHAITPGTWLSGTSAPRLRQSSGEASPKLASDSRASEGRTADQLAADHLGRDTPVSSLTVATEETKPIGAGVWQDEYDESYGTTLSFRRAHDPVPMEFRPCAVFDKLFRHDASDLHGRRPPLDFARGALSGVERASATTSVLDLVAADTARLRKRLGPADRAVLGEYLERVRDVECRASLRPASLAGPPFAPDGASGGRQAQSEVADQFKERMALMFDMIALAFRADVTRVASVMMAAEASSMTYDHLGVPESFHLLSHHQYDPDSIEKLVRIQTFHTRMFATFVRTLAELPDGDGSILDHSLILFGSNMSNSHAHDHFPLPLAVIGGGCGTLRGGQHLCYPDRTPMSNLLVAVLQRAGVPVQSVGDSTGECSEL
jgi:hypothetical protein